MSTPVDIDRRHRRSYRWLAALAVLAVAVAGAVLLREVAAPDRPLPGAAAPDAAAGPPAADPDMPLPEQLAARVVEILEAAEPAEHADHGHHLTEQTNRLVCAAETFGYEPAEASAPEQVEVVYARHMCAEVGPGLSWPGAVRGAGPLAVRLAEPATVLAPEQALPGEPGADHADRVRAIVPEQYHEAALAGDGFDEQVAAALRERFDAAG